jgi:hypothetical protein
MNSKFKVERKLHAKKNHSDDFAKSDNFAKKNLSNSIKVHELGVFN